MRWRDDAGSFRLNGGLDWSGARPVDKGEEREGEAGPGREGLSGLLRRGGLKLE